MRWFAVSVRARILGWVMLLVVLAMLASGFATYTVLIARDDERVNDEIRQQVEQFRSLVTTGVDPRTGQPLTRSTIERLFTVALQNNLPNDDEALFAVIPGRTPLRTGVPAPAPVYDNVAFVNRLRGITVPTYGDFQSEAGPVRYAAYPVISTSEVRGVYVVAIFTRIDRRQIREGMMTFAYVGSGAVAIVGLVGWLVAGRLLAPVRLVRQTARQITETDLTRRIPVRGTDDVSELARTFNAMLDRIEAGFTTQRQFLDDAGHELRTPITIVRGHLELMDLDDDPTEHAETRALVLDELDRMGRLVDDLTTLAKSGRPDFLRSGLVDLRALVEDVHDKARALAPRRWELAGGADGMLWADRHRLTQALVQLADNAAKHTRPSDLVTVGSSRGDGMVRLWVEDTGSGVDPGDAERIFDRFTRGRDGGRGSDGSGLGLAIVAAIAKAHGGQVTLRSSPGEGATFTLELPSDGVGSR